MDYRVIIAGTRSFRNYDLLKEHCLSRLQEKMKTHQVIIVSGHAHGADALGERFASELGLPIERHPAKWKMLGKAAGMIRNAEMARTSDALIAFWDGKSRGTAHMINFAKRRGLDVSVVFYLQNISESSDRVASGIDTPIGNYLDKKNEEHINRHRRV